MQCSQNWSGDLVGDLLGDTVSSEVEDGASLGRTDILKIISAQSSNPST